MTTIAYDPFNKIVASDSQETDSGDTKTPCKKLYKVNQNIVATAGGTYAALLFIAWLNEFEDEPDWSERPDLINLDLDEDFECLVIRPGGACYTVNRLFVPYARILNDFICLGSGSKAAWGALLAGADVKEAIKIACQIDAYSSGKIQTMKIT